MQKLALLISDRITKWNGQLVILNLAMPKNLLVKNLVFNIVRAGYRI